MNSFLSKKKIIIWIAVIVLFFALFIVLEFLSAGNWSIFKPITLYYTPIKVSKGTIKAQVIFSGTIDFDQHTTLQFQQIPANGIMIAGVYVKVGSNVQKNQLIASLDKQAILKQQQINLNQYWQQRLTFDQTTSDNNGMTPNSALNDTQKRTLLQSQATLNGSIYNVELQDQVARLADLYSPIDGIVTRADTPVAGVNIQTADEAKFEVINPTTLFFNTDVDETEVNNLHVGNKGIVIVNAYPTDYIQSTIRDIAFSSHQDTNNNIVYTVKLTLDNKNNTSYKYKFGMTGYVVFYEEADNILYIPNEYIHQDDTGSYVNLGSGKKREYVQTGLTNGKVTEIIKGVTESDNIYY